MEYPPAVLVGVMLSASGVFWTGEGLGVAWPGADLAIVAFSMALILAAAWQANTPTWKTYQKNFLQLEAQGEPMERLLDACVGLGLLSKDDGVYKNQPVASTYLCRSTPATLVGYILYSDKVLYQLWSNLENAIRHGGPQWTQTFHQDGGIFDHFFRTEEATQTFLQGMHGFGTLSSPLVVSAFDLSRFKTFVDLGGATGHLSIAGWEQAGRLVAVITQNIDGLHQLAGSRRVLELHGTARSIMCVDCQQRFEPKPLLEAFRAQQAVPPCPACGGRLKSATISFGQALSVDVLREAMRWAREADLFFAIGSSLVVTPAADLPVLAKESGARLVIINREPTPLDELADLVLPHAIGRCMERIDALAAPANRDTD